MTLVPVVVLVRDEDRVLFEGLLEQMTEFRAASLGTVARLNGWTDDMLRWSVLLHGFAEFIRSGDVEVVVMNEDLA